MENTSNEQEVEPLSAEIYELPGEPAIVINGMPEIPPSDGTLLAISNTVHDAESHGKTNFGEWLEGREVRKLFGEQYYSGTVTEYDKESGWYRVVYEDGDFEDLDWTELKEVLLPLDIMVPLKTLALKTLRKSKKPVHKSSYAMARSRTHKAKTTGSKGKKASVPEDASVMNPKVPEDASVMNSNGS
ncbi:hypothetical protein GBA52_019434 [Prunus armeniaca]|nr:hypothetical protein GBA52_019434 [Prunus armeniaca]